MRRFAPVAVLLLALSLSAAGCSDSPAGPGAEAVVLTVVSGDRQTGVQGTALPRRLVVEVTRRNGDPFPGAHLSLATEAGSGRIMEADSVTDDQGRAGFRWKLGTVWVNRVRISVREHSGSNVVAQAWARYRHTIPDQTADGWETTALTTVGMEDEPLTRMMDSLRAGAYREVHSVVILKDGRLVFEEYFPGHDFGYTRPDFLGAWVAFGRDTRHNTHSATKSVISALVGSAIDGGLVPDEDARVFDYFPDYASYAVGGKNAITVRDMLTMSSGLEWHEWDAPVRGGQNSIDTFNGSSDPIGYVLSQPLLHTPGTVFNYSGGTVNVLCQLVARAAGTSVEAFAREHLFGPLGVTNYDFPHHYTGITVCHGDIYITPRGMAKFGQLYLNGGTWAGRRILPEEWVEKSRTPWISVRDFHLAWADDYGYLWWLNDYAVGTRTYSTFKALGWGGQEIWVVPSEDLVVVFTGANYTVDPPCDELMTRYVFPALGSRTGG